MHASVTLTTSALVYLFFGINGLLSLQAQSPSDARSEPASQPGLDFEKEIAPILQRHCLRCHSPGINQGDISLATIDDLRDNGHLGESPDDSYLIELVTSTTDQKAEMPKDGSPLSTEEVSQLRAWIKAGSPWPEKVVIREKSKADRSFWAFQPLAIDVQSQPSSPSTIDRFIDQQLSANELSRQPTADRTTLIRRATYDLLGLPPSPEEVEAFVKDPDPDAYKKLIDRLLASPHYGERWGRHWLDVVRFGESNGFERNFIINSLWPFRDYVIESINDDKPFDQFIREHLAGDVLAPNDPSIAVGTSFLVAGPYDDVGNQDKAQAAQIRANTLDEMINATGQAFLGMTLGCARCHDHKFDPILQEDYYRFYTTFAGIRHGEVTLATKADQQARQAKLKPLQAKKQELEKRKNELRGQVLKRGREKLAEYQKQWTRPKVERTGTEETFPTIVAKWVRLTCISQDSNFRAATGFRIDEFEIYSAPESEDQTPQNVALASNGGKAYGKARKIDDFPEAYSAALSIDGKTGARFIAAGKDLTIELAKPTPINRIVFSSAKGEATSEPHTLIFVADYVIEYSLDGKEWKRICSGNDRQPINQGAHVDRRLERLEYTAEERQQQKEIQTELNQIEDEIRKVPGLPKVWLGRRVPGEAKGPFHVFIGGDPQRKGDEVLPGGMSAVDGPNQPSYQLDLNASEAERRRQLANWIVNANNPLTPRVLANRVWHYHFGTGLVDTPSDFGYMGGRPSHPELLDFLASELIKNNWQLKPLHRLIMNSQTYQQGSGFNEAAANQDRDARLLWRFPPRRLSAEEIRDTLLEIAGKLKRSPADRGGPGFRLYEFWQDNVATYVPRDKHGPDTYRRAVYHQNARAAVVDLMTEYDQPDCAFSTPKRAQTTTPLQALTMFNHSFTFDMARAFAERLQREAGDRLEDQVHRAYELCYARIPTEQELKQCRTLAENYGMTKLCRVLLNTSELIYVQ